MLALAGVAAAGLPVVLAPIIAALATAAASAYIPSVAATTPRLVDDADLPAANAARSAIQQVCIVAGPGFGAVLLLLGPPSLAFADQRARPSRCPPWPSPRSRPARSSRPAPRPSEAPERPARAARRRPRPARAARRGAPRGRRHRVQRRLRRRDRAAAPAQPRARPRRPRLRLPAGQLRPRRRPRRRVAGRAGRQRAPPRRARRRPGRARRPAPPAGRDPFGVGGRWSSARARGAGSIVVEVLVETACSARWPRTSSPAPTASPTRPPSPASSPAR